MFQLAGSSGSEARLPASQAAIHPPSSSPASIRFQIRKNIWAVLGGPRDVGGGGGLKRFYGSRFHLSEGALKAKDKAEGQSRPV